MNNHINAPSVSLNGNCKDKGNLSNNQTVVHEFSYFKAPIKNTHPYKNITLSDVAKVIKDPYFKNDTDKLRSFSDVDKARSYKGTEFDYVTFSGTFTERKKTALVEYSSLIALDFDHVEVENIKNKLLNQKQVDTVLLFISPSGDGIKWIVPATTKDEHEKVFRMYQRYCKDAFDLDVDESGKDIARACFIPHDENVVFNETFEFRKLEGYWNDPTKEAHTPPPPKGQIRRLEALSPFDDYNMRGDVISLLQSHGWTIEGDKGDEITLTRAGKKSGVSGGYRKQDKLFYVFTDATEFEASKAYNPAQVFAVLECGNDMKKARTQLLNNGYGEENSYYHDSNLESDKAKESFNFYTDDFKIKPARIAEYFKRQNFMRISEEGNDTITIIKNENKILNPFNFKTDTISFLKNHIRHPDNRTEIENQLVAKENDILKSWKLLKGEPYNLNKDTKETVYIPFKNGVAKIKKIGIELIDYKSSEIGFFIGTKSQEHTFINFDPDNRRIGQFEQFLISAIIGKDKDVQELTQKETSDVRAFYSMIGYLISNYKNPAKNPAIILSDEGADDERRNGGRGKSLLAIALQTVRGYNKRGGTEFEPGYRHVFADLQKYHDVYIIDDVPANFNYDALYTQITGDITAERKGTQAVVIPFQDAPKFVITTNWAVRYDKDATSTNRRFIEYKFSDFWNTNNKPDDYFNSTFFYDWDATEWQLFYELLITCVMLYLSIGVEGIEYSKDADNFRAYFSNDVLLDEFERIFGVLESKRRFKAMDFLNEYKNGPLRWDGIFHRNNVKRYIDTYIDYHKKDIGYNKREKTWYCLNDGGDGDDASDVPF